jgi:hypothetical protein
MGGNFTQFVVRNRALAENAGKNSGSNSNVYYSFNTPFTHWVAFTAESWTMSSEQLAAQAAWLEADLSAVDRTVTPWIVAFSHKSFQMDQTTWAMFDFLAKYKVDIQLVGWVAPAFCRHSRKPPPHLAPPNRTRSHWHQYTRYPPIDSRNGKVVIDSASVSADNGTYTNAPYPTLIVAGAPGNIEVNPKTCSEEWQINCSGNYGYGHLSVHNASHAHWEWNTTIPVSGGPDPSFGDDLWFVKTA